MGGLLVAYLRLYVPALEAHPASVLAPPAPYPWHWTLDVLAICVAGGLLLGLGFRRAARLSPFPSAGRRARAEAGVVPEEPTLSAGTKANIETFSSTESVDLYNERATDGLFPQERKAVERHFTEPGASVLDLGCGTGRATQPLSARGFDVTGVDLSKPMVDEARSIYPRLDFTVGDATDLHFRDGVFDHVLFTYYGLDYIHPEPERIRAMQEIHRVLKPGGTFVFSSHNWWNVPLSVLYRRWGALELLLGRENVLDPRARYSTVAVIPGETTVYLSSPIRQGRQLEACGFELIDIVGKRDTALRYLEVAPHYVARKPVEHA